MPRFLYPVHGAYNNLHKFTIAQVGTVTDRASSPRLAFLEGLGWASIGGTLAGGSLVMTKAIVMITVGPQGASVLWHPLPVLVLVLLAICSVTQMIALNRGLK